MNSSFFASEIAKQRTAEHIAAAEQSRLARCFKIGAAARRKAAAARSTSHPAQCSTELRTI